MTRWLAVLVLACCDADGGRWLLLDHDEVQGQNRVCWYRDVFGLYAVMIPMAERCEPDWEVH